MIYWISFCSILEHSRLSIESVENLSRVCRLTDLAAIARVQDSTYIAVSRVLDMGVSGILIPRVDTLEQAKRVTSYARFFPEGIKGCGGGPLLHGIDNIEDFNKERIVLMQMESPIGISNLDEILKNVEIDGIIIGPADLSINCGLPLQFDHPDVLREIDKVISICDKHKISCGMFMLEHQVEKWYNKGMNLIWASSDVNFFAKGYNDLCKIVDSLK